MSNKLKKRILAWRNAGKMLECLRDRDIRACDTATGILRLEEAFLSSLLHYPPSCTSGLIEQQRLFQRMPR